MNDTAFPQVTSYLVQVDQQVVRPANHWFQGARVAVGLIVMLVPTVSQGAESGAVENRAIASGRNDVVYLAPAVHNFESLALGNGRLGAAVWNEPGMTYHLHQTTCHLLGSSGRVDIALPADWMPGFVQQRLALHDGAVLTEFQTPQGKSQVRSWMVEGLDVLAIEITSDHPLPELTADLSIWERPTKPVLNVGPSEAGMTHVGGYWPVGIYATTALLRAEGATATAAKIDDRRVRLTVAAQGRNSITFWVACSAMQAERSNRQYAPNSYPKLPENHPTDEEASLQLAKSLLDQAAQQGTAALWRQHVAYWHDFWSKSSVLMHSPDGYADYIENLYYLHLYWTGSSSRDVIPPLFDNSIFNPLKDVVGWNGYWYQNTREIYWPLLPAGHTELWKPFFDLYLDALPKARASAKIRGATGAAAEESNQEMGIGLWREGGVGTGAEYGSTHLYLTTGTEVAHQWYDWYLFTGDEATLKDKIYPYMKEVIEFHLNYVNKEADGKYHVYPSNARESFNWIRDASTDLSALRATLPELIATSAMLGVDETQRAHWKDVLDNLAQVPRDPADGHYLAGTFLEEYPPTRFAKAEALYPPDTGRTKASKKNRFNFENVELEPVYPWSLLGLDSPADELDGMRRAMPLRFAQAWGNGWEWSGISAARLGMGDEAVRMMKTFTDYNQELPSGQASTAGLMNADYGNAIHADFGYDSSGCFATNVSELQFQSYNHKIWVYPPCWPKGWEGELTLHAEGGFIVSSQIAADGTIPFIRVASPRGGTCRVANPWNSAVRLQKNQETTKLTDTKEIAWTTQPGDVFTIEPETPVASRSHIEVTRIAGPKWPDRTGTDDTAEAFLKRWEARPYPKPVGGMLGLTREGLCPATLTIQRALAAKAATK